MGDIVQPCGFCPAQRRPANHVRRGTEQHLVGFVVCRSQQAARLHNIRPVLFLLRCPRLRGIGRMPDVPRLRGIGWISKVPPHPAKAIFEENCFRHLPLHRGRLILPDEVTSSAGEAAGMVQAGEYRLDGCQASWRIQSPMFLLRPQEITAGMVQAEGYRLDGCQASWRIQSPMFLLRPQEITAGRYKPAGFPKERLRPLGRGRWFKRFSEKIV